MSATQGIVLIMVGVLILYLIWAKMSPLNRPLPSTGPNPTSPLPPNETT